MIGMVTLTVLGVIVFALFLLAVNLGLVLANGASSLPDIKVLETYQPNQSTLIFDRNNSLIANIHGDEDRVVVKLRDISPNIQHAVMAIEDNRFYQHNGVDVRGTLRAMTTNLRGGDVQGGSTVTQQLVKNLFLTPDRTYSRKLAEALLAMRVEKFYSKNKIMEMYLNQVYWGNQAYGIEKAARRYFRKAAADLDIAESALLAGLLKAPEGLSPFAYPEAAKRRQLEVLDKMVEYGYITLEQRDTAARETIRLNSQRPKPSKHPYYVTYVIQELEKDYGEDVVRRGGLRVFTALDPQVQGAAEKALTEHVKSLSRGTHVSNGALVCIDVASAEIPAIVGGVDFDKSQFNNATQARRAAGSQFKPFVYLTGFRLGLITPETPISDRPVSFNTGYGVWRPKNWDGRFMGAMNIRRALTLSRNTPTVQIGMQVGIDEVISTARLAGITSPIDANFSSLLGSSGMAPIEMATAFSTFARGGIRMTPSAIRRVENVQGKALYIDKPAAQQVFDPNAVAMLNSILVDAVEKGTGKSAILENRQVAGKTGTTDQVRDIWFTGYTPDMVATVWMGNERYVPLNGVFSSNAAKVWHAFAQEYYRARTIVATEFPQPHAGSLVKRRDMVLNLNPPRPRPVVTPPLPELDADPQAADRAENVYRTFENRYAPGSQPPGARKPELIGPPIPGGGPVPAQPEPPARADAND
ncbi:MAG: PBP1A family penicillin-binding protein [Vampirovibrionales bacterium]|nr:PBP1A family penicillin-binding protein [Vampirovibrionales bacterium]